jgi:hypothetical protein
MTEDDTFNRLKRRPVEVVWSEFLSFTKLTMKSRGLNELRVHGDKEIEKWIEDQGWCSYAELKKDYDKYLQTLNFKFD